MAGDRGDAAVEHVSEKVAGDRGDGAKERALGGGGGDGVEELALEKGGGGGGGAEEHMLEAEGGKGVKVLEVDSHRPVAVESSDGVNFGQLLGRRRFSPPQVASQRGGIAASLLLRVEAIFFCKFCLN